MPFYVIWWLGFNSQLFIKMNFLYRLKETKFVKEWWWFHLSYNHRPVGSLKVKFWCFIIQQQSVLDIKQWVIALQTKFRFIWCTIEFFILVHCGSIRQTASILTMSQDCLRTGDKALVRFKFIKHPEYIKPGNTSKYKVLDFNFSYSC